MLKFSVHTEGLESIKDRLMQASSEAEHILAVQIRKDTSPYVPALTGSLDTRTRIEGFSDAGLGPGTGGSMIVYPGPYARYLYYGKLMVDPTTGSSYAPKGGTKVVTDKNLVFSKSMHAQAQSHWFEASKAQNLEKWVRVADKAVKDEL
jgi:hypothetical protein|nr:MAG TPA: Minor capsid protein [Caudoviricetes sp.]